MLSEKILDNTWDIRDLCQGVCCELDNVCSNSFLQPAEKEEIKSAYELSRRLVDQLTEMGAFNKSSLETNRREILNILNDVVKIENETRQKTKKIWEKEITLLKDFNQNDFKLCVKRLNGNLNQLEEVIYKKLKEKTDFFDAQLISNQNIVLTDNELNSEKPELPFGLVFDVGPQSFVMASDESSIISIKQKDYEINNTAVETFKDIKVCLKGYGCKIKTPKNILQKNKKDSLICNNNAVILNSKYTKISAIFCYDHGVKKINLQKRKLSFIAKNLNMDFIIISLPKFYKNNTEYFVSNTISRKIFNNFVDLILKDLNNYCGLDFFVLAKKLVGLNTNLRYNFIYRFSQNINSFLKDKKMSETETGKYIAEMFSKAVDKHNFLTRFREKESGAPLYFPGEDVFISLPSDFL